MAVRAVETEESRKAWHVIALLAATVILFSKAGVGFPSDPAPGTARRHLKEVSPVSAAQLMAPTDAPGLDNTLLGGVSLGALHDSYHIGQLAAARRRYGLDRLVG